MDTTNKKDLNSAQLGSINEQAQRKMAELKDRLKLNLFRDAVVSENYAARDVDFERIQELLGHPEQNDRFKTKDETVNLKIEHNRAYVDEVFSRVSGFGLPKELSLAVCYIISGAKTESNLDLVAAAAIIQKYLGREDETKTSEIKSQ